MEECNNHIWCQQTDTASIKIEEAFAADAQEGIQKLYSTMEVQLMSCPLCLNAYHCAQVSRSNVSEDLKDVTPSKLAIHGRICN